MRRFACEKWECFPEEVFPEARKEAKALVKKPEGFQARGFDIDPDAVELTLSNAKKAGVGDYVTARKLDLARLILPRTPMILITNPPYGERMLDKEQAEEIYELLGAKCRPVLGHSYYIITSHEEFESHFGRVADRRRKLYNGMLKCQLYMYYK